MFHRKVIVDVDAIKDLHGRMQGKLANHQVSGLVATVDVTFEDKYSIQFGTWAEFEQHRWTGPEVTSEVRCQWEFLVSVHGYEVPQRHIVTVKLSPRVKPFDVMRAVFSKDPSEIDAIEISFVPILCRVDFVNHILSKELIAVVDEWVRGLPQPSVAHSWFSWFEKNDDLVCNVLRYSAPIIAGLAAFMSLRLLFKNPVESNVGLTLVDALLLSRWAIATLLLLYVVDKSSTFISREAQKAIQKYGSFRMFCLTNGDATSVQELTERNKKQVRNFLISSSFSLLLNVVAGVIVYFGWSA